MNLELQKYRNLLPFLKFTAHEIEKTVKQYPLQFPYVKREAHEWNFMIPDIGLAFYAYIFEFKLLPTQESYFGYYLHMFRNELKAFSMDILMDIKGRMFKAYCAFMTDFHFGKLLTQELQGCNIILNHTLDMVEGIDLLIEAKNGLYALYLFAQTKRAVHLNSTKKKKRRKEYDNIMHINVPLEFNDKNKYGQLYLYGMDEVEMIRRLIV